MERVVAVELFGDRFVGREALRPLIRALGFPSLEVEEKPIPFDDRTLRKAASEGYILIWCPASLGGTPTTIRFMRDCFGVDPSVSEPCFYNQDWYLAEAFLDRPLDDDWHLVKEAVLEESRAVQPADLIRSGYAFPSAVLCVWTFFAWYYARNRFLWWHDFVWCSDTDHNGDRVYVGKYHDIDGVNKNGFSIHRHLALRNCYGAICSL